jgi:hypothetical protein
MTVYVIPRQRTRSDGQLAVYPYVRQGRNLRWLDPLIPKSNDDSHAIAGAIVDCAAEGFKADLLPKGMAVSARDLVAEYLGLSLSQEEALDFVSCGVLIQQEGVGSVVYHMADGTEYDMRNVPHWS